MVKKININEFLLPLYMFMFILFRVPMVLGVYDSSYNTLVLAISAVLILTCSVLFTKKYLNNLNLIGVILIIITLFILFLDILFRHNDYTLEKTYNFIINGFIPILLFTQIRNFKKFIDNYIIMATITFLFYFLDPINDYFFSFEYMIFGFEVMLPIFIAFYIAYKLYNSKIYGILSIVSFILILVWGNRMATLACIFFIFSYEIIFSNKPLKKYLNITILLLIVTVISFNLERIIAAISNILDNYNIYSYSLRSSLDYITGSVDHLSYGREVMWNDATNLFYNRPLLGYGIGYFQDYYGFYVHNIFLDLLISYGIGLSLFLVILLVNSFYRIKKAEGHLKIAGMIFFCISFPKLLTSVEFISESSFWLLILYGFLVPCFYKLQKREDGNKEIMKVGG